MQSLISWRKTASRENVYNMLRHKAGCKRCDSVSVKEENMKSLRKLYIKMLTVILSGQYNYGYLKLFSFLFFLFIYPCL